MTENFDLQGFEWPISDRMPRLQIIVGHGYSTVEAAILELSNALIRQGKTFTVFEPENIESSEAEEMWTSLVASGFDLVILCASRDKVADWLMRAITDNLNVLFLIDSPSRLSAFAALDTWGVLRGMLDHRAGRKILSNVIAADESSGIIYCVYPGDVRGSLKIYPSPIKSFQSKSLHEPKGLETEVGFGDTLTAGDKVDVEETHGESVVAGDPSMELGSDATFSVTIHMGDAFECSEHEGAGGTLRDALYVAAEEISGEFGRYMPDISSVVYNGSDLLELLNEARTVAQEGLLAFRRDQGPEAAYAAIKKYTDVCAMKSKVVEWMDRFDRTLDEVDHHVALRNVEELDIDESEFIVLVEQIKDFLATTSKDRSVSGAIVPFKLRDPD